MINKLEMKKEIINSLSNEKEIEKIIIFGSFNKSENPNDIDIAIVQNSSDNYLNLSMKYRKLIRNVSKKIAVDIFPILSENDNSFYRNNILSGEVIYEKGN